MKNTTNKINLSRLQVCPFGHKEPLYYDYKGFDFFDNRNHYIVNSQTEFLGVVVSFSVEDEITFSEIRNTQLHINLYNVSENRLIGCQTIRNIIACKNYRFDFPFEYDEINTDAAYMVEVFNPLTNKVLGDKHFYLYDSDKINVSPAHWYSVLSGCIVAKRMEGGKDHYRSYFGLNNKWCGMHILSSF